MPRQVIWTGLIWRGFKSRLDQAGQQLAHPTAAMKQDLQVRRQLPSALPHEPLARLKELAIGAGRDLRPFCMPRSSPKSTTSMCCPTAPGCVNASQPLCPGTHGRALDRRPAAGRSCRCDERNWPISSRFPPNKPMMARSVSSTELCSAFGEQGGSIRPGQGVRQYMFLVPRADPVDRDHRALRTGQEVSK